MVTAQIWILSGVALLTLEIIAVLRGGTLSAHLWTLLGIKRYRMPDGSTPRWFVRLARTIALFGPAWFLIHILTGGWL